MHSALVLTPSSGPLYAHTCPLDCIYCILTSQTGWTSNHKSCSISHTPPIPISLRPLAASIPEHTTAAQPVQPAYIGHAALGDYISQSVYYLMRETAIGPAHVPTGCLVTMATSKDLPPQQLPHMLPVAMMNGPSQGAGQRRHHGTATVIGSFVSTGGG